MQEKNISVIFYVNDSDGDTIIYNEKCKNYKTATKKVNNTKVVKQI